MPTPANIRSTLLRRSWRRLAPILAGGILAPALLHAATTETWIGEGTLLNWSDPANWADGTVPLGAADLELKFGPLRTLSTQLDLGALTLNRLSFANPFGTSVQAINSSSLRFEGTAPEIAWGTQAVTLNAPITLASTASSQLRLTRTPTNGEAALYLNGAISETNGAHGLYVDTGSGPMRAGTVVLAGANSFSGGLELRSGDVMVTHSQGLGTGSVQAYGGFIRPTVSVANDVELHGDLEVNSLGTSTWSGTFSSANANASLRLRGNSTLTLTGTSSYSGKTVVSNDVRLSGAGSLLNTSAIEIFNGTLTMAAAASGTSNRLPDEAPLSLRGAGVLLFQDGSTETSAKTETVGAVSLLGANTLRLSGTTTANISLTVGAVSRAERGTLALTGMIVRNANAAGRIYSTIAPELIGQGGTGTAQAIVPYAYATEDNYFVSYRPESGFYRLSTAERATSLTAGATANVWMGAGSLAANATVNSLWLSGGTVTGGATLNVTSGAVGANFIATFQPALAFGSREAIFTVTAAGVLEVLGAISGTDGLTKGGNGRLTLSGNNTFTGPLTINQGTVRFATPAQLGASTSAIVMTGSGATLEYNGTGPLDLSRPIHTTSPTGSTGGIFLNSSAAAVTLSGGTAGIGNFYVATSATAKVTLTGVAQHTGITNLQGLIGFASDVNLGAGGALYFQGAATQLEPTNNWTTNRLIYSVSPVTLSGGANSIEWSGPVVTTEPIIKLGTGTLRVTGVSLASKSYDVRAGTLELSGGGKTNAEVMLTGGATLLLNNQAQAISSRLTNTANGAIAIAQGEVHLRGHTSTPMREVLSNLVLNNSTSYGDFSLRVSSPGTAGTTLDLAAFSKVSFTAAYPYGEPALKLHGAALGGAAGTAFTRILLPSTMAGGLMREMVAVDEAGTFSLAVNDLGIDAAGTIGVRPLRATEYTSGPSLGVVTPESPHLLVETSATLATPDVSAQTLTMNGGSSLQVLPGEKLTLTAGAILVRTGAAALLTGGGAVDLGGNGMGLYLTGDLRSRVRMASTGGALIKRGPGKLTLEVGAVMPDQVTWSSGDLVVESGHALQPTVVALAPGASLQMASSSDVGGLMGQGGLVIASGTTTTLGSSPEATNFSGTISGAGTLRIVSGGGNATRKLTGSNTYTGGTILESGFIVATPAALSNGLVTVETAELRSFSIGLQNFANQLRLNGTLRMSGLFTITGATTVNDPRGPGITGAGQIELPLDGYLDLQRTYLASGGITLLSDLDQLTMVSAQGKLQLSGFEGSVDSASGITVRANRNLVILSSAGIAGNRLGLNTPVKLSSGTWTVGNGPGSALLSEAFGDLVLAGHNLLETMPPSAYVYGLQGASLQRPQRGTLLITASGAVGSTAPGGTLVTMRSAPAAEGAVVPYVTGRALNSSVAGVVVYTANAGLRQLLDNEYVIGPTPEAVGGHLRVSGTTAHTGTLSVQTLSMYGVGASLTGTGSLSITSGLVLLPHAGANRIENNLDFGANEAFITTYGGQSATGTFTGTLSGSGGLTLAGDGILQLSGTNNITGDLVLNGSLRLILTNAAQLGPATTPITVNGGAGGAGFRAETNAVTITRGINIADGLLYTESKSTASPLTLSGDLTGAGGVSVKGGLVVLAGTNSTYTGPTVVTGTLAITSDAALGNSSYLISRGGTLELRGPWNTTRPISSSNFAGVTINTNGFDAVYAASVPTGSSQPIAKTGLGTLTLENPGNAGGNLDLKQGQITVRGTDPVKLGKITLAAGVRLLVDNSTHAPERQLGTLIFKGAELVVQGHSTLPSVLTSNVSSITGFNLVTLQPQGTGRITLAMGDASQGASNFLVVRGSGEPLGGLHRMMATAITAGRVLLDSSSTGYGESFAKLDPTTDAGGVIGLRPMQPGEFLTSSSIANAANGGTTPSTAMFRATGEVSAQGASNTVQALSLASGSNLSLGAKQQLQLAADALLAEAGGAPARLTGGTLGRTNSQPLTVFGRGDLLLGSTILSTQAFAHRGAGVVTVTAPQPANTFSVWSGELRAGAGNPLAKATVNVQAGGRFGLNGAPTQISILAGNGTVDLAGSALTVLNASSSTTMNYVFSGDVAGMGSLISAAPAGTSWLGSLTLQGVNTLTGTLAAKYNALRLNGSGTALNATAIRAEQGEFQLEMDGTAGPAVRIGAIPVQLQDGRFTYTGANGATTVTVGTVTGTGFNRITAARATGNSGTVQLTMGSLVRQGRAGFSFRTVNSGTAEVGDGRFLVTTSLAGDLVGLNGTAVERPILPYAVMDGEVVTYENGALRKLAADEQTPLFTANANLRVGSTTPSLSTTVTVNSVEAISLSPLLGSGTLNVTSGLVTVGTTVQVKLNFGSAAGMIFNALGLGFVQLNGAISGSNGLTLNSAGSGFNTGLALMANNNFTGTLTVNGGWAHLGATGSLGSATNPVVLRNATLYSRLNAALTVSNSLELQNGQNQLASNGATYDFIWNGRISGPGDLRLTGNITLGDPSNAYSGATIIDGNVKFSSDGVFGQTPAIKFNTLGTLLPQANWTTSRTLDLSSASGSIKTANFDVRLKGRLLGTNGLGKSGPGRLIVEDLTDFTGQLQVTEGILELHSHGEQVSGLGAYTGGTLIAAGEFTAALTLFGGTLVPGEDVAELQLGGLNAIGGAIQLQLASVAEHDLIEVMQSRISFSGATQLQLDLTGWMPLYTAFSIPLFINGGPGALNVSASNGFAIGSNVLTEGEVFWVGEQPFQITYAGGDGNDVYLSVPEPGSMAILAVGAWPLLGRWRRRRQRAA